MSQVRGFIPWIAFVVMATRIGWGYGALTGLVLAGGLLVADRRAGRAWGELVIEVSGVGFFAVLGGMALAAPDSPLKDYAPAMSLAWLGATAWISLAIRKPFTLGIARRSAPPEVWGLPLFYRINAVVTSVWAVAFTLNAAALAVLLHEAPHATAAVIAVKVAGFALPALFTARYPAIAKARAGV
ncbi:hypothetical protein [Streptomyces sp. XD-27]|uniref:hypothetical protein n=1 Tax=Streptomyces sp. XD-27 TaxID=3062779 RepID=UPI0026F436E1|nr:hypothetical protein [Streptomyces sp. XD-27]WKX71701.1 hypothetical protein Q3Y56_18905 [Streptomyces sp. XD-27]